MTLQQPLSPQQVPIVDGGGVPSPEFYRWAKQIDVILRGSPNKIGTFTRVLSLASGSQSITGVGFKPSLITFQTGVVGGVPWSSAGKSDGVTNSCVEFTTSFSFAQPTFAGIQREDAGGANYNYFVVSSLDADGFTLAWTKSGTPTATATIFYTCFR